MKFKLSSAKSFFYDEAEIAKYSEIGFKFEVLIDDCKRITNSVTVDICTLEELMNLIGNYGEVVIGLDTITIFNDYL